MPNSSLCDIVEKDLEVLINSTVLQLENHFETGKNWFSVTIKKKKFFFASLSKLEGVVHIKVNDRSIYLSICAIAMHIRGPNLFVRFCSYNREENN